MLAKNFTGYDSSSLKASDISFGRLENWLLSHPKVEVTTMSESIVSMSQVFGSSNGYFSSRTITYKSV